MRRMHNCRAIEIAESGLFKGSTSIDEAEIRGRFEGDLIVRNRLLIKATGRVSGRSATAKSRSNAAARFSATSRRNRLVNWGRLSCRAGSQLSYRMIDPVFINMVMRAPGAGVPAV
jgi:hypothetical protein